MYFLLEIAILCICLQFAVCDAGTYKAAAMEASGDVTSDRYPSLIHDASKMNADILVLPAPEMSRFGNLQEACDLDKYDEIIKSISGAAKKGRLYVVAHLLEKVHCEGRREVMRSGLVFDRQGSVVSVYRKPVYGSANCNISTASPSTFATDFGVTFGLIMEEDLILTNVAELEGVKNFVMSGNSFAKAPFLSANQFSASWSFTTNSNLVSSRGIFSGIAGLRAGTGGLVVAELHKNGGQDKPTINFNGAQPPSLPDLSQYAVRPLDVARSAHGHAAAVCHQRLCCHFYIKTSLVGNPEDPSYGLAAFSGVQHVGGNAVGVQNCAVLACAGLYKRSCTINSGNILFDEISIAANFSENSVQFPIVNTMNPMIEVSKFQLNQLSVNQNQVIAKLYNTTDVIHFGVFSRDYARDYVSEYFDDSNKTDNIPEDYISIENVEEFFDYLWIRFRVVIILVSIYILEMM